MNYNEKDSRKKQEEAAKTEETDNMITDLKGENIIYGLLDAILVNWGRTE